MSHWTQAYLGKAYSIHGRGPDAFNCWTLICDAYEKHQGIKLPAIHDEYLEDMLKVSYFIRGEKASPQWRQAEQPYQDFDVVELSANVRSHHVGMIAYVDGVMHILHAWDMGVHLIRPNVMSLLQGLKMKGVYRYVGPR